MRNERLEEFKNNLEEAGFNIEFIKKSIEYFNELEDEKNVQELEDLEEVLDYYHGHGSFSFNIPKSEENLKEFREDIINLFEYDTNDLLHYSLYFEDIEVFELQILYVLYYEFYPLEG